MRRPVWLEQSEQRGEKEGMGKVMQGIVGHEKDLGFHLQGGGSPGGL